MPFLRRHIPPTTTKARARRVSHTPGRMNKLETRFAAHLDKETHECRIASYLFEPFKIRLADRTYLTPDFMAVLADGTIVFYEVKGFWEDDARVKVKVAAEQYPYFEFVGVTWNRKAKTWEFERFAE